MNAIPEPSAPLRSIPRVRVFVDYWNLQLSLNEREAALRGLDDYRFKIRWKDLGPWLAKHACAAVGIAAENHTFEGVIIYASYNPKTSEGRGFHKWATTWLNRQAGVRVECRERKPKAIPRCPGCHREVEYCPRPECGQRMTGTIEKGVDTLMATDMIRLAWEDAYDLAVLATSDSDLVPAVEFLNLKARKVIQAGFPPLGVELATTCWASFDLFGLRKEVERS